MFVDSLYNCWFAWLQCVHVIIVDVMFRVRVISLYLRIVFVSLFIKQQCI